MPEITPTNPRGAGRKPVPDPRIARSIKFTAAEWAAIHDYAEAYGLNVSEYIRRRALSKPRRKKEE